MPAHTNARDPGVPLTRVTSGRPAIPAFVAAAEPRSDPVAPSRGDHGTLEDELTWQAFHDQLTGLPNRALFLDRLEHALHRRHADSRSVAVLLLDLDDFKTVNDSLGHVEGDLLISLAAGRLATSVRAQDTAARLGGDEFALLLDDLDLDEVIVIAERILDAFSTPFELTERAVRIGVSVGIALGSPRLETPKEMVRAADLAMYAAKANGKDQYRLFEEAMLEASLERLRLLIDIRGAVERGEFCVQYQPVVLLPSGTIVGMEALVRWVHPERGLMQPTDFIPLAEASGTIIALGEFVLREACRQARGWQESRPGQAPMAVNVNVSGSELANPGLVASVALALSDSGLCPELLTLEITETDVARESDATVHRLRQLKEMGVGIAIDDFGTGYSSLSYLRSFPVDIVKIDRSFVDRVTTSPRDLALVRAIVGLAHSLHMITVAEGVETAAQVRRLSSVGCDQAQGYAFGRPLDAAVAAELMAQQASISLWVGHAGRELAVIKSVVSDFEKLNPGLRVDVVGGMDGDRAATALKSPEVPNIVSAFEPGDFGFFAASDGLMDLGPFLERDGIDPGIFTSVTDSYTVCDGKRWALPVLANAYGLYSNTGLMREARLSAPPRTTRQLTEQAKRLTTRAPDGSLAVVGSIRCSSSTGTRWSPSGTCSALAGSMRKGDRRWRPIPAGHRCSAGRRSWSTGMGGMS